LSNDQTTRDSCTRQHELQFSTQRPFQQHPFSFYTQLGSTFGFKKTAARCAIGSISAYRSMLLATLIFYIASFGTYGSRVRYLNRRLGG
jgi:hypothetical protein